MEKSKVRRTNNKKKVQGMERKNARENTGGKKAENIIENCGVNDICTEKKGSKNSW
jgi:ribosomal protein S5